MIISPTTMQFNSSSFTSEDNLCGVDLLGLVARGHIILTEIRALSERIPPAFVAAAAASASAAAADDATNSATKQPTPSASSYVWSLFGGRKDAKHDAPIQDGDDEGMYAQFLFDFRYLRDPEECERSIGSATAAPRRLEADFVAKYGDSIVQFYRLFESIYLYQVDLNEFADDLASGRYVQHTLESVLSDMKGRQLAAEALHLYSAMLTLMQIKFDDGIRERMIVAYLRYQSKGGLDTRMRNVVKLFSSIGIVKKDGPFEEKLFMRCSVNDMFVEKVVGCLMAEDIYPQACSFPSFAQRSTRLAKQAAFLYSILYLQLDALRSDEAKMRVIVDRFFSDNWMLSINGGVIVDLTIKWSQFGAAKAALENVMSVSQRRGLFASNHHSMKECSTELHRYLNHGDLTDEFILAHKHDILECARKSNVALRWSILHRNSSVANEDLLVSPRARINPSSSRSNKEIPATALVGGALDVEVLQLLLLTAHFEETAKEGFHRLIENKADAWNDSRSNVIVKLSDLSKYFRMNKDAADSGSCENNELSEWFVDLASEVQSLSIDGQGQQSSTFAKAQFCIEALSEMAQYEVIDESLHLKTSIADAQAQLLHMTRIGALTDDTTIALDHISDMSYAEESVKVYSPIFQEKIAKDPSTVTLLRSLFLKLSHCLESPMLRLLQWKGDSAGASEIKKIRHYHEKAFASLISSILQIIPVSVFNLMLDIADVKENIMTNMPAQIEISSLKHYDQGDHRHRLSNLSYEMSVFTEGVTRMQIIPIGNASINPLELLHTGLRRELVKHISAILHHTLRFPPPSTKPGKKGSPVLEFKTAATEAVSLLVKRLDNLKAALEFSQDYTGLIGSPTWEEELGRIIAFSIEQESNKYMSKRVHHINSIFQSSLVPIPRYAPTKEEPLYENFTGRTMSALLKLTEPQKTVCSLDSNGWFLSDGSNIVTGQIFALLHRAMGVQGLVGIDKLLSYRSLNEIQRFVKSYRAVVKSHGVLLEQLRDSMFPEWRLSPKDPHQFYENATKKTTKLFSPILICFRRVGQAQLLRRAVRNELRIHAEVGMRRVKYAARALNKAYLEGGDDEPADDFPPLDLVIDALAQIGEGNVLSTEFLATDPLEGLPVLLALFVVAHAKEFVYDADFGSLVRSKEEYAIDGWPFVFGMATLLRQFHQSYAHSFLAYLGQYVRSQIGCGADAQSTAGKHADKSSNIQLEVRNVIIFMSQLCSVSFLGRNALYQYVPQSLVELGS
jgi:WASH complex subunit strumpellin